MPRFLTRIPIPVRLTLGVLLAWAFGLLSYATDIVLTDIDVRKEVAEIQDRGFHYYATYYGIYPALVFPVGEERPHSQIVEEVEPGTKSAWVSDMQVFVGGIEIHWKEHLRCDVNPFDGEPRFKYYLRLGSSSHTYDEPVRKEVEDQDGFFARNYYTGEIVIYPDEEMDCFLRSEMTLIEGKYGIDFTFTKDSQIVRVRFRS